MVFSANSGVIIYLVSGIHTQLVFLSDVRQCCGVSVRSVLVLWARMVSDSHIHVQRHTQNLRLQAQERAKTVKSLLATCTQNHLYIQKAHTTCTHKLRRSRRWRRKRNKKAPGNTRTHACAVKRITHTHITCTHRHRRSRRWRHKRVLRSYRRSQSRLLRRACRGGAVLCPQQQQQQEKEQQE